MAIRTYKVTLDSKNYIAPEPICLRQGDKTGAVVIDATLMDNGSPVSLDGLKPSFMANTADGKAVIADNTGFNIVNASGGEFTYQVSSQIGSVPGKIKIAYFSFADASGNQSTFDVVFIVNKAADMTKESAKDWVSNLNEIIEQYNQWANDAHNYWEDFVNENKAIIESIDPGGTLLKEVIDARKPIDDDAYPSLGNRLNAMEDGYDQVNKAIPASTIQEAYKSGIDRTKSKIKSDDFNIGFITDTHWEENYDANRPYAAYGRTKYYDSLNHLSNIQQLDGLVDTFICGGDNTESGSRSLDVIKKQSEIFALKASTVESDHFMLLGNHDQGSSRLINYGYKKDQLPLDDYIHQDEIKELWSINDNENGELRDGDSLYFYKDYPDKKIRLIGINTSDDPEIKTDGGYEKYIPIWLHTVRQKQLDWLANTALQNVPEDYHVLVFGHAHLDPSLDGSNHNNPERHVNFDILLNLLNAFKNGQDYSGVSSITDFNVSVNAKFSKQGPRTLVGYFCGHVHQQRVNEYDGIKNYIFDNSFFEDTDDGTEKQDSWAVIAIDTANRKIKIYGFGRTTDQTYDY